MQRSHFLYALSLTMLMFAAGCSESVAPPSAGGGIPHGALEGEYGFEINGSTFDNATSPSSVSASIRPYTNEGPGAVQLSITMDYSFPDGTRGSVNLWIPLLAPKPESFQFSDGNSLWNPKATGAVSIASAGFTDYESIPGGTLTITKLDTVHNLVSGFFQFSAYKYYPNVDLHDTIPVSKGYFNDISIDFGAFGQGTITALLNGTPFNSDTGGVEMIYTDSSFGGIELFDYGPELGNDSFISIQRIPLQTGTYVIDSITGREDSMPIIIYQSWFNPQRSASTLRQNSSGVVTITSCNVATRRISGTFQFVGVDSLGNAVTISNGKINNVLWTP